MLVLPTLPVIPTTGRRQPARAPTRRGPSAPRAVSATSIAGAVAAIGRLATSGRPPAPARRRGGDEVVAVALGDERHEQLAGPQRAGVERGSVELDVGADERAARRRGDVGCPEPHGAERYRRAVARWRTVPSRIHLVVLFGGQSAEHDVSCVTAAHVLAAVDPARYRVTPIGISTDGEWALADGASRGARRRAGRAARPARPVGHVDRRRRRCSPAPTRGRRAHRRAAAAARPDGRGRHGAGAARAGRRRLRRRRRARLGAGDGQGDGQAGARRQRHPPGPVPGVRRARAHARPARRAGRRARPAVLRQAGEHGVVGRRHEGAHGRGAARRDRVTP